MEVPIYKGKGDRSDPASYRPIALTSCIAKLYEKMIKLRFEPLIDNSLIAEQAGFRKGRSTLENLIQLDHDIKKAFTRKRVVSAVFFDIKKAYDTLDPFAILRQAQKLNVGNNFWKWCRAPDKSLRVCIDPHDLNMAIKRPHHPMPTFDEAVLKHSGAKYFTKLDARHGYWSLELDEESSKLTTFNTPYERYKFKRIPFGLISAQDEFQRRMEEAFEGIRGFSVIVDDIIISGRTDEEHDSNVRSALIRAREKCVKLNLQKCVFKSDSIPYFGHIISEAGIHPDPRKTVLGMMNYLARYIPNLSSLNQPLRKLANQREFKWEKEHNSAFTNIKESICDSLSFLDPTSGNIELQVDASKFGLGATILQNGKTVSFASRSLNSTEQNYSQIEKKLYAILFGCLHYHQYLYGQKFIVVSDHRPLQVALNRPISKSSPRLQRMLLKIQPYDFTVIFRPGEEIPVADALSRLYLPEEDTETQVEIESSPDAAEALETPHGESKGNPHAEALTSSPITAFAALTPPPKTPDLNSRPTSHDLSPAFHTPIRVPSTSHTTHADLQGALYSTRSGRCEKPVKKLNL
ncbi:hypothetical protein QYM36_012711 [Artemia franciscana]|uniref:Reverse transcriptase domain-containing protein n=1 Tax=Artemia franciscana TaxID=6661 RepID=A0AA88HMP1_ARTSF|nr:hypothetical protein QYM36_012711 [Artemia franciscana]